MQNLVEQIKDIQSIVKKDVEDWIDLRLRYYENRYELLWGDSQYDTDHRGVWGYSSIHTDSDEEDIKLAVKDMLTEIDDFLIREGEENE